MIIMRKFNEEDLKEYDNLQPFESGNPPLIARFKYEDRTEVDIVHVKGSIQVYIEEYGNDNIIAGILRCNEEQGIEMINNLDESDLTVDILRSIGFEMHDFPIPYEYKQTKDIR